MQPQHGTWVIATSFFLAMMLTVFPLSGSLVYWRPDWVAMVLVYWCVALPHRVGILVGWSVGFLVDAAYGHLIGLNGMLLALVAYFSLIAHQRMRIFPEWKQALCVSLLVSVKLMIAQVILNSVNTESRGIQYWYPALTSGLCWPLILVILRKCRRHFSVS